MKPDWKRIDEDAPRDKVLLLWWVGVSSDVPKQPPTCAMGAISSHEIGFVWTGEHYLQLDYFTHWDWLPEGPDPGFV